MPVWHEATRALRESGELALVGIAQEQHPDRCRLFAQWHGIDWPILWDPFNLTGSAAVPLFLAVDEHGIVRATHLKPEALGPDFLERSYEAPAAAAPLVAPVRPALLETEPSAGVEAALAHLLFGASGAMDEAIAHLEQHAGKLVSEERAYADSALFFRLGVAYRQRHDSDAARPGDFQRAVDAWARALELDPNQYIWRRRLQQYGPRLDKPYPFFDWIQAAQDELRARGVEPLRVRVPLSGAEIADRSNALPANPGADNSPDPQRKVTSDPGELVHVEVAAVRHTGKPGAIVRAGSAARVHVLLRPDEERDVHWTNDAGPAQVWVAVPRGWRIERNLFILPVPADQAISAEPRRFDFEVLPSGDAREGPQHLRAYALYYVCEGQSGACVYRRQDFEVSLELRPKESMPWEDD